MTYKINLEKFVEKLILLALVLTPLFSFQEAVSLIFGGIVNNSTALTSPYVKGIKDLIFILIILVSLVLIFNRKKINLILLSLLAIFFLLLFIPAYLNHDNVIIFFAGIRWFMPFILVLFLIRHIDKNLLTKIAEVLFWLFIFHFIFQIIQLFFAGGWFGINSLGLSARNPGIFFIPSTAGVFAILVLFFSKFYMDKHLERKIYFLIPISLFLTASGTGIGTYIIFMSIYYLKEKYFLLMPIFLIFLAFILIFALDTLSGRSGLLEESFGTRLLIFRDVFYDASLLPTSFGYGTSTGYLIANKFGLDFDMAVTDSWFATIFVNFGLINSFIVVALLVTFYIILIAKKRKEELLFLTIFTLFSATTVFTESFPANLLFAVLLAYYIKPKRDKHETPNNPQ